jgi:hypothetical protein
LDLAAIYAHLRDFIDPLSLDMGLQMEDLSKSQILMLDAGKIIINVILFIMLLIWIIKNNVRKMTICSICILVFIIVEFFLIDAFFQVTTH